MDLPRIIQGFFLMVTATCLLANVSPSVRGRFLAYGARASSTTDRSKAPLKKSLGPPKASLIDTFASLQVPHTWFKHFYVVSVVSSLFWATQFLFQNSLWKDFLLMYPHTSIQTKETMSRNQVMLAWLLMLAQGSRRLYECIVFSRPSNASMGVAHWLLGIVFYLVMSMAIWVEGIPVLRVTRPSLSLLSLSAPSLRTLLCVPLFLVASGIQHDCHRYLGSLKKYTLPTHPMFQYLICPHYTAECAIYLALCFIAAPAGSAINKTLMTALIFVIANLGVTAAMTKQWYRQKFGREEIDSRWKMIPLIY